MKKVPLLVCLFLCFKHVCFAQFLTGQKVLGGAISLGYGKSKDTAFNGVNTTNFSFRISPSFGKFKNEKTLIEFSISGGYSSQKYERRSDTTSSNGFNFGAGYSVTKLYPIASKVFFTTGIGLDLGVNTTRNMSNYNNPSNQNTNFGLSFGVSPGILMPVRNNSMILRTGFSNLASANIGFSKNTSTNYDGTKSSTTAQNAGVSFGSTTIFSGLYVGLSWLLK